MPTQPFPSDNLDPLLATRGLLREGSAVVLPREGLGESERTEIFQRIIDRAQRSVAQRDQLAVELKHTMSRYDPVSVIGEIARDVHSDDPGEPDRAPAVFSWDAKLEHLLGLALALDPVPSEAPPPGATAQIARLVDSLFEVEADRIFLEMLKATPGQRQGLGAARLMLRLEHLMDRMEGYTPHLEVIHRTVFEPLHDRFVGSLGFCPADIVTVVSAYVAETNAQRGTVGDFVNLMDTLMYRHPIDGSEAPTEDEQRQVLGALDRAYSAWRMLYVWNTDSVADASGLPRVQVEAMLSHLSVTWACQPNYLLPDEPNLARLRPAVRLANSTYFVPLAWNFVHGLFPWIADLLKLTGEERLLDGVRRQRDAATETLTRGVLEGIFGSLSMGPLHYDHEGRHGEIDALVATGNTPLVVECKAQSLTPAGRRGAPGRIERVVDDVVRGGTEQLARARRYLTTGACEFADREGARATKRLQLPVRDTIQILVTFERMDPLAATGGGLETPALTWLVCLADLLMVADLLPNPAELFDYAELRASLLDSDVTVYVEADAVAVYLANRFRELLAAAANGETILGYASGSINDYYTFTTFGLNPPRPASGVPTDVLASLERMLTAAPELWPELASAVMRQDPRVWRKWAKRRRRKGHRVSGEFRFVDPPLLILTGDAMSSSDHGDTPTLKL